MPSLWTIPCDFPTTKRVTKASDMGKSLPPVHTVSSSPEHSLPSPCTTETTPESSADGELPPASTKEPVRSTAPMIAQDLKPNCESDQGCEPATSVPVGVLVEPDTKDWLINWDSKVLLPTLPHPESSVSSSPLVLPSIETVLLPLIPPSLPLRPPLQDSASPSVTPGFLQSLIFSPNALCGEASGPFGRQLRPSEWILWLCHQPLISSLHQRPSALWLHQVPSSLQLHLCLSGLLLPPWSLVTLAPAQPTSALDPPWTLVVAAPPWSSVPMVSLRLCLGLP
ncbi:hypothetical protein DPX16_11228 [Anabarilius grahami]|uniref:Uncharacterized protein n=1 Tax=Anabarilius grahami TaxID=495550 RepID=A0A3N0Y2J2_ANAGA|nr:hypothetical protein DPX16_11228 [Anabarilius grahami]